MYQVVNEMPDPPTTYDHSIPPAFNYIVFKAMAKKPEDRYQSAKDMASDLRKFKKLTIPAQLPTTAPEKKSQKKRERTGESTVTVDVNKQRVATSRNWLTKTIGVSAAVIILIFAALYIYGQWQSAKLADDEAAATAQTITEAKNIKNRNKATKANAGINFTVIPWGEVIIDGKNMGASPPFRSIKLPAGNHKIEIRNATFSPYRKTIKLKAGENIKIRHKFK
jgi:serine/threonine-protein kinase